MNIHALSVSTTKGVRKHNVPMAKFLENHGIEGDAHAGKWHRQVSLLAQESIDTMVEKGLDVKSGDFAENITTTGLDLTALALGDRIQIGEELTLTLSQKGKVCHHRCAIYYQAGDCVMPREGIFGVVTRPGTAQVGDPIRLLSKVQVTAGIIGTAAEEEKWGETLRATLHAALQPAFVRFDQLDAAQEKLQPIMKDLVDYQGIEHLVLLDATGDIWKKLGLQDGDRPHTSKMGQTTLYVIAHPADLNAIFGLVGGA
ncbi:MOSC domain-containing protein [Chrysiogenes arsenatis]|uniref:MOSC domain-containing protein n=1 Tax=Chrysiogenes arsenatis TaxID=309797 RepID=UPI0003FA1718|nr:MOSC domain-containing protein [Chrysiogenes arsenatis]